MTTFSTKIFDCPHCSSRLLSYELSSYYIIDSVCYSDGYTDSNPPMLKNKIVLICPKCNNPFWPDDVKPEEWYNNNDDIPHAMDVYDLPLTKSENVNYNIVNYYLDLINVGFANTSDREVKLRIDIWHRLNHNYRYKQSLLSIALDGKFHLLKRKITERINNVSYNKKISLLHRDNLQRLIDIFNPIGEEERLLLVEMLREIGNFEDAKLELKKIENPSNSKYLNNIHKKIRLRKSKVFKLN